MQNKIISIGWLGTKRCYLNLSKEEAIKRYRDEFDSTTTEETLIKYDLISEFSFEDEFSAYDVWGK